MPYVEGRIIHDADSHLMELPDCLDPYFTRPMLARYHALPIFAHKQRGAPGWVEKARAQHDDPEFRAGAEANILLRKNQQALGAFRPDDRPRAVDYLGFASQLVFTTFCLGNFQLEYGDDVELAYAAATAHNRMMTDFCSVDRRLLATGYVPLMDFERAAAATQEAIALGAKAILIASRCPKGHSPSHIGFDPVWRQAEEAGLPILFHVGGEEKLNPDYFENGLPRVKDFHGGEENFTSVSFMPIPNSVMQTLACLSASPSEIARRQVRVTPYPHEDTGWIIRNSGEEMMLFSSDFPHVEGGRNPLKRFNDALEGLPPRAIERFYTDNFIDLMGEGLAADLRRPAHLTAAGGSSGDAGPYPRGAPGRPPARR